MMYAIRLYRLGNDGVEFIAEATGDVTEHDLISIAEQMRSDGDYIYLSAFEVK